MKSMVEDLRMPAGSDPLEQLALLQSTILACKAWIELILQTTSTTICKATYDRYVRVLITSLFCLSPQGRIESIACILLADVPAWLRDGYIMGTQFKTAITYGYQVHPIVPQCPHSSSIPLSFFFNSPSLSPNSELKFCRDM